MCLRVLESKVGLNYFFRRLAWFRTTVVGLTTVLLVSSLGFISPVAAEETTVTPHTIGVVYDRCSWEDPPNTPGDYTRSGYCLNTSDITVKCTQEIVDGEEGTIFCLTLDPSDDANGECTPLDGSEVVTCIMLNVPEVVLHCEYDADNKYLKDCLDPRHVNAILEPSDRTGLCLHRYQKFKGLHQTTAVCPDGYGHPFFFQKSGPGEWEAPEAGLSFDSPLAYNNCYETGSNIAFCRFAGKQYRFLIQGTEADKQIIGGAISHDMRVLPPRIAILAVTNPDLDPDDIYQDDCGATVLLEPNPEESIPTIVLAQKEATALISMTNAFFEKDDNSTGNGASTNDLDPFEATCKGFYLSTFSLVVAGIGAVFTGFQANAAKHYPQINPTAAQQAFLQLIHNAAVRISHPDVPNREYRIRVQRSLQGLLARSFVAATSLIPLGTTGIDEVREGAQALVDASANGNSIGPGNDAHIRAIQLGLALMSAEAFRTFSSALGDYFAEQAVDNEWPYSTPQTVG